MGCYTIYVVRALDGALWAAGGKRPPVDFAGPGDAWAAISKLDPAKVTADLPAVHVGDYHDMAVRPDVDWR